MTYPILDVSLPPSVPPSTPLAAGTQSSRPNLQGSEDLEGRRSITGDITPQERTRNNLVILHDMDHLSWRKIAQLPEYAGISHIDLNRIYHGGEPASLEVRKRLGWPMTAPAPVCGKCGDVHVTKRCMKKSPGEPRKTPIPWEHYEQVTLFHEAAYYENQYPELGLLFAVPNGGKRDVRVAKKLKEEGVKAGVPDIWLPVSREEFHGLVIELKARGGILSEKQAAWLEHLNDEGFLAVEVEGSELAFEIIIAYLTGFSLSGKLLWDLIPMDPT